MKIHVDFTVEIPHSQMTTLGLLAGTDEDLLGASEADSRLFVQMDAEDYLVGYLTDNGIDAKVVQRNGQRVTDTFAGYQKPLDAVDQSPLG